MSLLQGLDTAQKALEQLAREFREATEAGETTMDEALYIIDTLTRMMGEANTRRKNAVELVKHLLSEVETQQVLIASLEESVYH